MAAAPLFQKKGIPSVTSGATHPELPKWAGDAVFMTPFGDDNQSFAIADYTYMQLKARKVVVWTDNSMDFTKVLLKFFKQRFQELGGEIILEKNGFKLLKEKGLPVPPGNANPKIVIQNELHAAAI